MGKLTDTQKLEIVNKYKAGESIKNLAIQYGVVVNSITSILKVRKIIFRGKRKYKLNECYFDIIDTSEKAYWLGFIYADGNVYKSTLAIKLANKDLAHIYNFKRSIDSEHLVKPVRNKDASVIKIGSVKLTESLIKAGVIPNKSLVIKFPKFLSKKLVLHFIRGVFDGDGWITFYKPKDQINLTWSAGMCSGSKDFLFSIQKVLELVGVMGNLYKRKGGFQLTWNGNKAVELLYNLLYSDADVYLQRKFMLFNEFLQQMKVRMDGRKTKQNGPRNTRGQFTGFRA